MTGGERGGKCPVTWSRSGRRVDGRSAGDGAVTGRRRRHGGPRPAPGGRTRPDRFKRPERQLNPRSAAAAAADVSAWLAEVCIDGSRRVASDSGHNEDLSVRLINAGGSGRVVDAWCRVE